MLSCGVYYSCRMNLYIDKCNSYVYQQTYCTPNLSKYGTYQIKLTATQQVVITEMITV